ncbi:Uncharacterised protein [uncultured archaeon]|nr:Uncharacterised protein [uncultured archaeon]
MYISDGNYKHFERLQKKKVSNEQLEKLVQRELQKQDPNEITPLPAPEGWEQTDSLLIECPGYWWLHSKVDKRWRAEGKSEAVGGLGMCAEAKQAFRKLQASFGIPPWDFIYRFEPRDLKKFKLAPRKGVPLG